MVLLEELGLDLILNSPHFTQYHHKQDLHEMDSKQISETAGVPEVCRYWKVVVMLWRSSAGSQGGGEGCGQHEPLRSS